MEIKRKSPLIHIRSLVEKLFLVLDRLFNRLFTSEWNPLYRTGTLAAFLLFVTTATGLYLIFFYKLHAPYESVVGLQNQILSGRWIRSVHRWASDATVVAVIFHVLRMFAQGKSWGPRTLPWISGVVLTLLLLVSAWTGFVLVWDEQGQALAIAGAKIFDSMGIFGDPISRAFNGESDAPSSSFFFMNLFLHIIIPLSMVLALWLHTSKMARAVWFPNKKIMFGILTSLITVSIIWPAPLLEKGNMLVQPDNIKIDWFYNFWMSWAYTNPGTVFIIFALFTLLLISIPIILKPFKHERPTLASNDPKKCQGCTQCVQDCPYEAIQMVPRMEGRGSPIVALSNPDLCVGCGICSASCDPFTMGPDERRAGDLYKSAKLFMQESRASLDLSKATLVIACQNQSGSLKRIGRVVDDYKTAQIYPVECSGTVHAAVIEYFAKSYNKVLITACPERNCSNKDGFKLLTERVSGAREPTFTRAFDRSKVSVLPVGDGEESKVINYFEGERIGGSNTRGIKAILSGIALLFLVVLVGEVPMSFSSERGVIRLSWRLTGQVTSDCKPLDEELMKNTPAHMRKAEICVQKPIDYHLTVFLNGEEKVNEVARAGGFHSDRPIYVTHDISIPEGTHKLDIRFKPTKTDIEGINLTLSEEIEVPKRGIVLLYLDSSQEKILIKKNEAVYENR